MSLQSMAQLRARNAWNVFERLKQGSDFKDIADNAKKLPMRIRTAGLLQALAFLQAKGDAPELRTALSEWVLGQLGVAAQKGKADPDALFQCALQGDNAFLRRATAESLAWLEWFNRFAEPERKRLARAESRAEMRGA